MHSAEWTSRPKHLFVLSGAGKPIFSLHGDEDELASLTAVMQALVSYVDDLGDTLRAFKTSDRTVVFSSRGPLIFVAVSGGGESVPQLHMQLT